MIFNPLFLSNDSNSHMMANKAEKLSKNQYLFSDIVKVVMNPSLDSENKSVKKSSEDRNELELQLADGHAPVQMKLKFISNLSNELNVKELTDLLPPEISKLISGEKKLKNDAVSYVSKDQLNGELKDFINNLIGAEVIQNIILKGEGLLLNLEDSKSTVNIELSGISKSSKSNITVQTVVIPQKEKLLSLFADDKRVQQLFRYKNNKVIPISESGFANNKPSLSLYVFKNDTGDVNALAKNMNFIPQASMDLGSIKNSKVDTSGSVKMTNSELLNAQTDNLISASKNQNSAGINYNTVEKQNESLKIKNEPVRSDFDVNKITIVKKVSESNNELGKIIQHPNNHSNVSSKKLELLNLNKSNENKTYGVNSNTGDVPPSKANQITNSKNHSDTSPNLNRIDELTVRKTELKSFNSSTSTNKNGLAESSFQSTKNSSSEPNHIDSNKSENNNGKGENRSSLENLNLFPRIKNFSKISINTNQADSQGIAQNVKNDNQSIKVEADKNSNSLNTEKLNNQKPDAEGRIVNSFVPKETDGINRENKSKDSKPIIKNIDSPKTINNPTDDLKIMHLNQEKFEVPNDISVKLKGNIKSVISKNGISVLGEQKANLNSNSSHGESVSETGKELLSEQKNITKSEADKNENTRTNSNETSNVIDAKGDKTSADDSNMNSNGHSFLHTKNPNIVNENENSFGKILNKNESINSSELKNISNTTDQEKPNRIVRSVELVRELSKFISKQENGTLSFNIKPEHLGLLKITLDNIDNVVKARIEVENEQAKQLLERNLEKLHQELSENGVKLNSLNISLGNQKKQKDEKLTKSKNQSSNESLGQVGESEEENQKKSLGYNTYEYIA